MQINHYLPRELPQPLRDLTTLALDLRWSWHHGADDLWRVIDPEVWEATGNPWLILETVSDLRLNELSNNAQFLKALQEQLTIRDEHYKADTWFPKQFGDQFSGHIAYFSMEFGLSESLPIYSGGLGVLAGDHLKTACDLDVPLLGIGLLYQQGYFRQEMNTHGEQIEFYPFNDPSQLPVIPLRDDQGEWVRIRIDLPGRSLRLRTWHAQVGRRSLLLLDSNDLLNDPGDRAITSELYGGGDEMRLQQEMVLGIGGWRLLERLGIECPVCHLNEGHAALAVLERARQYMQQTKQSFNIALRATRAGNLFTTHTPVKAGFDSFAPDLFRLYFTDYAEDMDISIDELMSLGRVNANDHNEPFNMAYLAVRCCGAVNGVSRLHGKVSRDIFQPLFPHWPHHEVPIGHVTNGVHMPSWDSDTSDDLWTRACGKGRWRGALESVEEDLRCLEDSELWHLRSENRHRLVTYLRNRIERQQCGRGAARETVRECTVLLDPYVLTLGFARRFVEYKRTNLLLHDPERLIHLFSNRDRPVQLVFAGKAHPRDLQGKQLLHEWQKFIDRPEVRGRIVFIEDYDLSVAAQLTQGVDVWINTPRRPWEASGTSGMKVLVNGGINFSELDGWWAEAYTPEVGWALGNNDQHVDTSSWDHFEANKLYETLEQEIIPCFYRRDEQGIPHEWINLMRESMAHLTTQFSSNRMLREYVEQYYLPLATDYRQRCKDDANAIQQWYEQLTQHWQRIYFGNVNASERDNEYHFEIQVYLDDLPPDAVSIELYAEPAEGESEPHCIQLTRSASLASAANAFNYTGSVAAERPITDYTPRIVPMHARAKIPLEASQIIWYR